jgi:riboflavin biosynthesis pyrimidine reductase
MSQESAITQIWPGGLNHMRLGRTDVVREYALPSLSETHVRVHLISSLNGAATVSGVSGGLASPGDRMMFGALRELADVILVGAGTVRAEGYRGARTNSAIRKRRLSIGKAPVPPIAVITRMGSLKPNAAIFSDTYVPPIIFTTDAAPASNVDAMRRAGGDVHVLGPDRVDIAAVLDVLNGMGLRHVLCEGGPSTWDQMINARAIDEVCMTLSPTLVAGENALQSGMHAGKISFVLMSAMIDDWSAMFLRYQTTEGGGSVSDLRS